jgi:hypothetical protein
VEQRKIFVLVDKSLSRSQQTVQCGHALLNFSSDWKPPTGEDWAKMSLVILAVDGEDELLEWWDKLDADYKSDFLEPYWNDRMTAFAAYGPLVQEQVNELKLL